MKTEKIKIEKAINGYVVKMNDTTFGIANNEKELFNVIGLSMQGSYPDKVGDFVEIEFTLLKEKE